MEGGANQRLAPYSDLYANGAAPIRGKHPFETHCWIEQRRLPYSHIHNSIAFIETYGLANTLYFHFVNETCSKKFIFAPRDQCVCTIILQSTKQTKRLLQNTRAAVQKCPINKVFLKVLQNPERNIYAGDSLE